MPYKYIQSAITIKSLVTHTFQPLNVCVCDSCLERSSVFPFSCTTHCPFSVKPTSDMLSSTSLLGSCTFSSGVLGKVSFCGSSTMSTWSGLGVWICSSLNSSLRASLHAGSYNKKMFNYRINSSFSLKTQLLAVCWYWSTFFSLKEKGLFYCEKPRLCIYITLLV